MLCYTCYDKRTVREKATGRPLPCPECGGLALSCCEGTDRELDHQRAVVPPIEEIQPSVFLVHSWERAKLPRGRMTVVRPSKPLNELQHNYA